MSCPDCFQGAIMTDYKAKGEITTIHGRRTYVAQPPAGTQPKGIIIIVPDAFGLQDAFPNNKHLADTYASQGPFIVYLPDFMDGYIAPHWLVTVFPALLKQPDSLWGWLEKPWLVAQLLYGMTPFLYYNGFASSMPRVTAFFSAVRDGEATEKHLPIGVAGFCWGGQHTFALASGEYQSPNGRVLCDAHFTAHPSNVSVPERPKAIKLPFSLAAASEDKVMTLAQAREVEAILREKMEKGEALGSEVVYYEGAGHGFGVRADPGNEEVVKHADDSIKQAVEFYRRVFGEWKGA